MKVAVVGASGNVGTAVLNHLVDASEVTGVVGIARRMPDRDVAPYSSAEWHLVDVGAEARDDAAEEAIIERLVAAFDGVDAVVHLAWLIQPNHERDLLRRTNVEGTARVARAVVRAGVGHLVCASSWAVYSPAPDLTPRDEAWARDGVRSSHYSVDKAAQERVLDDLEAEYPELVVTRMRTGLVLTAHAGASIARYFIGPWVPRRLLAPGALPILPTPTGLRAQVVHADDAGRAYLEVLRRRAGGGFNLSTGEALLGEDLARILDHGRTVPVPAGVARSLLHYAWRSRLFASDPGFLDMATTLPVMDVTRARRELEWEPRHDADATVRDLLDGMVRRAGGASVPLRPHDRSFEGVPGLRPALRGRAPAATGEPGGPLDRELLRTYLDDHLSGSTAGVARIERMARAYADTPIGPELRLLAGEIGHGRDELMTLMDELGLPTRPHRQGLAWVAERLGRLKTNGRVTHQSPLTVLLELELMRSAVAGQAGLWQTMVEIAGDLGMGCDRFAELAERSIAFQTRLEELHARVRGDALRASGERPLKLA